MNHVVLMMQQLVITNKAKLCAVLLLEEAKKRRPFLLLSNSFLSDFISRSVNTTTAVCLSVCLCACQEEERRGEEVRHQSFLSRHETEVGSQLKARADLTPPPTRGSVDVLAKKTVLSDHKSNPGPNIL